MNTDTLNFAHTCRCFNSRDSFDWFRQISLLPAPSLPLLSVPFRFPMHYTSHIPPRLPHGGPSSPLPPGPQRGMSSHQPDTPPAGEGPVRRGRGKDQCTATIARGTGGWNLLEWAWQSIFAESASPGCICLHRRGPLRLRVEP
jgi:hypothetical protein